MDPILQQFEGMASTPFDEVPDSVLINVIFPSMPLTELSGICQANWRMRGICANPELWQAKLARDYPDVLTALSQPNPMISSYKELYMFLQNSTRVPVIYRGDRIGFTYVNLSYSRHRFTIGGSYFFADIENHDQSKYLTELMFPVPGYDNIIFLNEFNQPVDLRHMLGSLVTKEVAKALITNRDITKIVDILDELANKEGHPPMTLP